MNKTILKTIVLVTILSFVLSGYSKTDDQVIIVEDIESITPVTGIEVTTVEVDDQIYSSVIIKQGEDEHSMQLALVPHIKTFDSAYSTCSSFGDDWRIPTRNEMFGFLMGGPYEMLNPSYLGYDLGPDTWGPGDKDDVLNSTIGGTVTLTWFVEKEGAYSYEELKGTDIVSFIRGWDEATVGLEEYINSVREFGNTTEDELYSESYLQAADQMSEGVDLICVTGEFL